MKVKVCYDECAEQVDIIDIPVRDVANLEKLQEEFFQWLFDKSNNHKYWVYDTGGHKSHCAYDVDAFISWMNQYRFGDGNCASCVTKNVPGMQYNYPILYF